MKRLLCYAGGVFLFYSGLSQTKTPIIDNGNRIVIKELEILNSDYRETNLSVTPDGQYLFFMSDRGGQKWSGDLRIHYKQEAYDGDIWFSKKTDFVWTTPRVLNEPINTYTGEDEPVISPDGQTIYYQSWAGKWQLTGGPYYQAKLEGETWTNIKGLGDSITSFFYKESLEATNEYIRTKVSRSIGTDGMSISPDGNTFIVAFGKEYSKPMDLFLSRKVDGKWTTPRKMSFNTAGDERSVFIAADGRTLYFASDGYGGFGGIDIFKTTFDKDGNCGDVINIGKPFNTEKDDYGFIITASGDKAYFVTDGDIFSADLSEADKMIKPLPTKVISGTVKTNEGKTIANHVALINTGSGKTVAISDINSLTGKFSLVSEETEGDFELEFTSPEGFKHVSPLRIVNDSLYEDFNFDFVFEKESSGLLTQTKTIIVYFDYDKDILKDQFRNTIRSQISDELKGQITRIELSGFTDSDGSAAYNQNLGLRRARSVANFMRELKLPTNEIKSFGKLRPVASNDTDEGKSMNRRVEIKVFYNFKTDRN